jgi:hypothetical protein
MKKEHLILISMIVSMFSLIFLVSGVNAATYYMPDNCSNLQACFNKMIGGDTLIIRDGTYKGNSNVIDPLNYPAPPNGSSNAWTTIKAEHDGEVFFDGENQRDMFLLRWTSQKNWYIKFEGIIWGRVSGTVVYTTLANYVKFIKCGAFDAGNNSLPVTNENYGNSGKFGIGRGSNYILLEGCYAWGAGRNSFAAYGNPIDSTHIIFRNCIARIDRVSASNPIYGIGMYSVDNCLVQNCITIDSDQDSYYINDVNGIKHDWGGGLCVATTDKVANNISFVNCLVLNSHVGGYDIAGNNNANNIHITNSVFWDLKTRTEEDHVRVINVQLGVNDLVDRCTFNLASEGTWGFDGWKNTHYFNNNTVSNYQNMIAKGGYSALCFEGITGNHNNFYNNTDPDQNSVFTDSMNINPIYSSSNPNGALKYITRIEKGSNLDGLNIGANIIYQVGKSGTLWGEEGYNLTQDGTHGQENISLWPFPNEDLIKRKMAQYYYDPQDDRTPLNGSRGFAAPGLGLYRGNITLTSYIWEYLGNPCPSDICNYSKIPNQCGDEYCNKTAGETCSSCEADCGKCLNVTTIQKLLNNFKSFKSGSSLSDYITKIKEFILG